MNGWRDVNWGLVMKFRLGGFELKVSKRFRYTAAQQQVNFLSRTTL